MSASGTGVKWGQESMANFLAFHEAYCTVQFVASEAKSSSYMVRICRRADSALKPVDAQSVGIEWLSAVCTAIDRFELRLAEL